MGEETQQTQEKVIENTYSEIELKAIDQGWIPKEEFDGDPSMFIDAPEFVRRGELFGKIEQQSKQLKAVREALEALRAHHSKVKENEYQRALRSLKDARKQAMIEGETERALALEEQIDVVQQERHQLTEELKQPIVQDTDDSYSPEMQSWVERNPWYETNKVMRKTADSIGKEYYEAGYSAPEVLKLVERDIRKEFAHKFVSGRKTSPVEGTTRGNGRNKDDIELTPEEADIMRKIVAVTPGFTEEQYKKELKALGPRR